MEKITKSKELTKKRTTNMVFNLENARLRLKIWKSLRMNSQIWLGTSSLEEYEMIFKTS